MANSPADLYPEEVLEEIQKAYDYALIDRRSIHPDDVLEEIWRSANRECLGDSSAVKLSLAT
ncbi:MAG: DUF1186 domain-containing protein [Acidobacteriota bacterium]|nr:DUF1186 domain-containing protein [Acidobacteriota bacterium]